MRNRLACLFATLALASCAAPGTLTAEMRPVVTCLYDRIKAHPGMLSVAVYAINGDREYQVEFTFRGKAGTTLIGTLGVYPGANPDGTYAYTNESPRGQPDNNGLEELDFLGGEWDEDTMTMCHLMPTLMDEYWFGKDPPPKPVRRRVEMPG
jgi:hypothetical protein